MLSTYGSSSFNLHNIIVLDMLIIGDETKVQEMQ